MALLFTKLFNGYQQQRHNNDPHIAKRDGCVSDKLFAFSKDHVRIVLFRECDFRGRKLLFDSTTVKKEPLGDDAAKENYAEISDGYGYVYTKPQPDFNQISEMVFGSVAMSFRGTSFKMHTIDKNRLMFTQVFSSPRHHPTTSSNKSSVSDANGSFKRSHSTGRHNIVDSGTSSSNSMASECLSVQSTASDTVLVYRRQHSTPLDVPLGFVSNPSLVGDSGCSYSSTSTCCSLYGEKCNSSLSLSCNSLYKKWLRRNSTSLGSSLPGSGASIKESYGRSNRYHNRSSKLGLAIIVEMTSGKEEEFCQFFMEHVSLLEAILWRSRHSVETAYLKSQKFTSLMMDMSTWSTQCLVNLLSGSCLLPTNQWVTLSSSSNSDTSNNNNNNNGCDKTSISSAFEVFCSAPRGIFIGSTSSVSLNRGVNDNCTESDSVNNNLNKSRLRQSESVSSDLFGLKRLLSAQWDPFNLNKSSESKRNVAARKFIQGLCELLEMIDVKDTNFFMSTLVTAVLTHHLGWVSTCLPSSKKDDDNFTSSLPPFNPLWGELSDLYGAVGHPTKTAQTIVTGTTRSKDLVSKILVTITYFIRCCDVDRKIPIRADVAGENRQVETICQSCIPKVNYKKYEDHIREIMDNQGGCVSRSVKQDEVVKKKTLSKTRTCHGNLSDSGRESSCSLVLCGQASDDTLKAASSFTSSSKKSLSRKTSTSVLCTLDQPGQGDKDSDSGDVLFVLGDDEELVGLRKFKYDDYDFQNSPFKDSDFAEKAEDCRLKPSTSWSSLTDPTGVDRPVNSVAKFVRSQSVPPVAQGEENTSRTLLEEAQKTKYKYSGVKFNIQQYPQILSNYMRSKNLEISNLHFGGEGGGEKKLDDVSALVDAMSKYPLIGASCEDEREALQTPSNASELEFTSDLFVAPPTTSQKAEEVVDECKRSCFVKHHLANTVIREVEPCGSSEDLRGGVNMKVANLPMPKSTYRIPPFETIRYTRSLMRAATDVYMPDMILQGPVVPKQDWESKLRNDLALASQHSPIDQPVEEAVAIIANLDTWQVQLMSSHTFIIDKGSSGIRVGMSQLVANMLESLLHMWKLNVPVHFCLLHIEQKLQELCIQSKALAELLLATEFCSMEQLTSTLQLEVNDVPLLLAVASTHTPEVTRKYGVRLE